MNDTHLIEMYLSGDLTDRELQQVEIRIQNDPAFAAKVSLSINVNRAIAEDEIMDFRTTLEKIHDEIHA